MFKNHSLKVNNGQWGAGIDHQIIMLRDLKISKTMKSPFKGDVSIDNFYVFHWLFR